MGFRGEEFAFQSPAEAVDAMIACVRPTPNGSREPERVPLERARGRILARPIILDRDSPAFDHSAMDGYAIRLADLEQGPVALLPGIVSNATSTPNAGPVRLTVVGESRIGCEPPAMPSPETPAVIRIVTGAGVPLDADCIVKREDVTEHPVPGGRAAEESGAHVAAISISPGVIARLRRGNNIRRRGENARAGEVVLEAGSILDAACVGVLAAVGAASVEAVPRLRVSIMTTGDELVPPEHTPSPFQIRNSNGPALRALLGAPGWIEVSSVLHGRDDGSVIDEQLRTSAAAADAIVLTGGVSMGHRDPVRAAIERFGARIIFHGLPQRPGKPMLGAILRGEPASDSPGSARNSTVSHAARGPLPIFALPGNPISAMVTCTRIVLPVLAAMAGAKRFTPAITPRLVTISNHDGESLGLWWHRLAAFEPDGTVRLLDARGSGDLIAGGRSDGFVEISPHEHPDPKVPVPFFGWM